MSTFSLWLCVIHWTVLCFATLKIQKINKMKQNKMKYRKYFVHFLMKMDMAEWGTEETSPWCRLRKTLMHACALNSVWLFTTPWTVAHQVPLSMKFPGKNTGMGFHFLLQGIFLTQGSNLHLLCFLNCQSRSLPAKPPGKTLGYLTEGQDEWNVTESYRSTLWYRGNLCLPSFSLT